MRAARRVPALSDTLPPRHEWKLGDRRRSWSMTIPSAKMEHIYPGIRLLTLKILVLIGHNSFS